MATAPRGMVLPPVESDGRVEQGYGTPMWLHSDARVPAPLPDRDVYALAAHVRSETCPGRHLFDVLESLEEREVEDEHAEGGWRVEHRFVARLTCVRCGLIQEWAGTRDGEVRDPHRIQAEPLAAGDLVAQMIRTSGAWYADADPHWGSTWAVHRGDERVGVVDWGRGPRGREYFAGRLFAWPDGEKVQAPTVAGVLRKMSRRGAATGEGVA